MATDNSTETPSKEDAYETVYFKIHHIRSLVNLLTTVDADQCDVNDAAFAIEKMLEEAEEMLSNYHSIEMGFAK